MRNSIISVLLGILSFFVVTSVGATVLVSEDYEVSNMKELKTQKGWGLVCNYDPCPSMDITSIRSRSGGKSLRMVNDVPNCKNSVCDDSRNAKIYRDFTPAREIYERYWVYYEPINAGQTLRWVDGDGNSSSKQHYFNAAVADPVSAIFEFAYSGTQFGSPSYTIQNPTGGFPTTNLNPNFMLKEMPTKEWVCVQSHLKMNDVGKKNGIMEVWINGTQTTKYTDLQISFKNTDAWRSIQVYRQGTATPMYRYEDDYVISTDPVGCGPMDQLPTPNPPAPPKFLKVR